MPDSSMDEKVGPKKGGKLDKYKWWIVGGLAVIAILVFYFVNKNGSSSANTTANSQAGVDPNTGVPYAAEYGGAYGFGVPGPAGPTGPAGPRGGRGPRGPRGPGGKKPKPKHKHMVTVPRVKGFPYAAAAAVIRASGLRPVKSAHSSNVVDIVVSQSPDAGDRVERGSTVTLSEQERHGGGKHPTSASHPFMQNANAVHAHNAHARR